MNDDLERRIQDVLDRGGDPKDELAAEIGQDEDAMRTASELGQLDRWLHDWPLPLPNQDAFEAMATRVEQRLGEELAPLEHDPTEAPVFDDIKPVVEVEPEEVSRSGEFALNKLTEAASTPPPAPAAAGPLPASPQKVSELRPREAPEEKSSSMPWVLAAAAAVGLAVTGTFMFATGSDSEPQVAMQMPADTAASAPVAAAEPMMEADEAELEQELADEEASGGLGSLAPAPPAEAAEPEPETVAAAPAGPGQQFGAGASMRRNTSRRAPLRMEADLAPAQLAMAASRSSRGGGGVESMTEQPSPVSRAAIQTAINRSRGQIRSCFEEPPARLIARVRLKAGGGVDEILSLSPSSPCASRIIEGLTIGGAAGAEATLRYDLQ